MGKDIGQLYNNSQYQLSTQSIKAPFLSSLVSKISPSIELTITSIPSVIEKRKSITFCVPKILSRMI